MRRGKHHTGHTGESSWTVHVNVVCDQGCTLTQGYWKTHSRQGTAPYDDTWAQLGAAQEGTPFFLSGKTYYQVLWTAPAGRPASSSLRQVDWFDSIIDSWLWLVSRKE